LDWIFTFETVAVYTINF